MSSRSLLTDLIESIDTDTKLMSCCSGCESVANCPCKKRVDSVMQLYLSHNVHDDDEQPKSPDAWLKFMQNSLTELLDDYIHLIQHHSHELDHESMQCVCDDTNCQCLLRHYNASTNDNVDDEKYSLYQSIMDCIHCYLCHSYDVGLRKTASSLTRTHHRAHLDPLINQRFASSNKFSLQTNASDIDGHSRYHDITYMDDMLEYLQQHCSCLKQLYTLQEYLASEQYDTDAVVNDHDVDLEILNIERTLSDRADSKDDEKKQIRVIRPASKLDEVTCVCGTLLVAQSVDECYGGSFVECDLCGNTLRMANESLVYHCPNGYHAAHAQGFDVCLSCAVKQFFSTPTETPSLSALLKEYVRCSQLSSNSFAIGYRFYYWNYHTSSDSILHQKFNANDAPENIYDHGGYTAHELYIEQKYKCIKNEILNNRFCKLSLIQFRASLDKAKEYILSNHAKQMRARGELCTEYGIHKDDAVTVDHLLSIILYTDWTDLCTAFSRTFRKSKPHQNILSIKDNNREFAHWSRLLRETVEIFGENGHDYTLKNNAQIMSTEQLVQPAQQSVYTAIGPFYCGISSKMVVPHFNIRLCALTSLSKQRKVAERFAGDDGMVIELDNKISNTSRNLMLFNCAWISNHSAEDERLIFGGAFPIRIASIRNTQTQRDYRNFILPLYHFHCLLSGTLILRWIEGDESNEQEYKIIDKLIRHYLATNGYKNKYDKYVNDMFAAFVNAQTQIVLNLNLLHHRFYYQTWNHVVQQQYDELDRIHENVLRLFKNAKELVIYSNKRSFNLSDLLLSVQSIFGATYNCKHMFRIMVQSETDKTAYYPNERSWLFSQYEILSAQKTFDNFQMDFQHESKSIHQYVDRLTICY